MKHTINSYCTTITNTSNTTANYYITYRYKVDLTRSPEAGASRGIEHLQVMTTEADIFKDEQVVRSMMMLPAGVRRRITHAVGLGFMSHWGVDWKQIMTKIDYVGSSFNLNLV